MEKILELTEVMKSHGAGAFYLSIDTNLPEAKVLYSIFWGDFFYRSSSIDNLISQVRDEWQDEKHLLG